MQVSKRMMISFAALAVGALACSGSDGDDDGKVQVDDPAPPTLGTQIDRAGRAAISTALIAVLEGDDAVKGAAKDAFNAAGKTEWNDAAQIGANLAVYDSLDMTCGNQLLADASMDTPARYAGLAGALNDDRLHVNLGASACTQYFAVELTATAVADLSSDCGGRSPLYDVIDVTYSALAIGAIAGVGDGVASDNAAHNASDFPFLAP